MDVMDIRMETSFSTEPLTYRLPVTSPNGAMRVWPNRS